MCCITLCTRVHTHQDILKTWKNACQAGVALIYEHHNLLAANLCLHALILSCWLWFDILTLQILSNHSQGLVIKSYTDKIFFCIVIHNGVALLQKVMVDFIKQHLFSVPDPYTNIHIIITYFSFLFLFFCSLCLHLLFQPKQLYNFVPINNCTHLASWAFFSSSVNGFTSSVDSEKFWCLVLAACA